jgi:hypothetical protein
MVPGPQAGRMKILQKSRSDQGSPGSVLLPPRAFGGQRCSAPAGVLVGRSTGGSDQALRVPRCLEGSPWTWPAHGVGPTLSSTAAVCAGSRQAPYVGPPQGGHVAYAQTQAEAARRPLFLGCRGWPGSRGGGPMLAGGHLRSDCPRCGTRSWPGIQPPLHRAGSRDGIRGAGRRAGVGPGQGSSDQGRRVPSAESRNGGGSRTGVTRSSRPSVSKFRLGLWDPAWVGRLGERPEVGPRRLRAKELGSLMVRPGWRLAAPG